MSERKWKEVAFDLWESLTQGQNAHDIGAEYTLTFDDVKHVLPEFADLFENQEDAQNEQPNN